MILESENSLLKKLILRSSGETTVDYWKKQITNCQSVVKLHRQNTWQ